MSAMDCGSTLRVTGKSLCSGFHFFRNYNFVFIPQTQIVEAKYKPIPPGEYSDKLSETVTRSVMERVE